MASKGKPPVKKRKKGARKKFFPVVLPLTASKVKLYSYSPEELEGSIVKLDLTRNLRGKNLELRAKIKYSEEKLTGELLSLKITASYIKRIMRRGIDYIEDSFETFSKDSKLRIKPFMITRNRVSRAVKKEIRNISKKFLESHTTIRNTSELFSEIMTGKLQKALSIKVKKIYPLATCEIRIIEVIGPAEKTEKSKDKTVKNPEDETSEEKTDSKKE
ncbi:MAG: hypothetical protein Q8P57_00680 [Candidatus Pacearchaeota archaeon]|nr:hypothetical protein [Candidatus Pacearchaeota archaeon]